MIDFLPLDAGDMVAVRARGELTHEDYRDTLLPRLERAIREHGSVRCLCVLGEDFEGLTPAAAWDDLRFDLRHRRDFERIAVVTENRWVRAALQVSRPFFAGELRLFPQSAQDDAEAWIQEDPER